VLSGEIFEENAGMAVVQITVAIRHIYEGTYGDGSCIFTGVDIHTKKAVKVKVIASAAVGILHIGEHWVVKGIWEDHYNYGRQLIAKSLIQEQVRDVYDGDEHVKNYLKTSESFRNLGGFGERTIDRLFAQWPDVPGLLDKGDINPLLPYMPAKTALNVISAWRADKAKIDFVNFVGALGMERRVASKLWKGWGLQSLERIKKNPYQLLVLINDWHKVDRAASSLGVSEEDERRLAAATVYLMWRRMSDGNHTLTHHIDLTAGLQRLLRVNEEVAERAVRTALDRGEIVGGKLDGYQPRGAHRMEQRLKKWLLAIANRNASSGHVKSACWCDVPHTLLETKLEEYELLERAIQNNHDWALTAEQKAAILTVLQEPLVCLTGGAGCGKTTILKAICHIGKAIGAEVYCMALAGRAADRLRESTGDAYTIDGFIRKVKGREIKFKDVPFIVIDEASMVDLPRMYRLMECLPERVRLLFVGDPAQLPPISFGLVFHQLVKSKGDNIKVRPLTKNWRSDEATGIPAISAQIREGIVPRIEDFNFANPPLSGVYFGRCDHSEILAKVMDVIAAIGGMDDVQVIAATKGSAELNEQDAGTRNINKRCQSKYALDKFTYANYSLLYLRGDRVIYLENDYERDLFNGSLGTVLESDVDPEKSYILCEFDGMKHRVMKNNHLNTLSLAWAITIHKSQGSQFKRVIIPIYKNRLTDRSLLYTAITRAEEQVVLVGDWAAFCNAVVSEPTSNLRQIGLEI
jgi:exodeoxyribonuclease V alpha subunit